MYLVLKAGNDPNFTVPKGLTDETALRELLMTFVLRRVTRR